MLNILWVVAVAFVCLWALGFALNFTVGGLIHILLVLADPPALRHPATRQPRRAGAASPCFQSRSRLVRAPREPA